MANIQEQPLIDSRDVPILNIDKLKNIREMKLYLLQDTINILVIEDSHGSTEGECNDRNSDTEIDNFLDKLLSINIPKMFLLEGLKSYNTETDVKDSNDPKIDIGLFRTHNKFKNCVYYNSTTNCEYGWMNYFISIDYRLTDENIYQLAPSHHYFMKKPIDNMSIKWTQDNSILDLPILCIRRILEKLTQNLINGSDNILRGYLDILIDFFKDVKKRLRSFIEILFENDQNLFVTKLLDLFSMFKLLSLNEVGISDNPRENFTGVFQEMLRNGVNIYKKIFSQLSNDDSEEYFYDKEINEKIKEHYFKWNEHFLPESLIDAIIKRLKQSKKNLNTVNYKKSINHFLKVLFKNTTILMTAIGSCITDIYTTKRLMRIYPFEDSEFKLIIIYAGNAHTNNYIRFLQYNYKIREILNFNKNSTSNPNGCLYIKDKTLDKFEKILNKLKNEYKIKYLESDSELSVNDEEFTEKKFAKKKKKYIESINELRKNIFKLRKRIGSMNYMNSPERLKHDLNELVLEKNRTLYKYYEFIRNNVNSLKEKRRQQLQQEQNTKFLKRRQQLQQEFERNFLKNFFDRIEEKKDS